MKAQARHADGPARSEHLSLRQVDVLQRELDEVRREVLQTEVPHRTARPNSSRSEERQRAVIKLLQVRRERGKIFDASLFGEPAWDMLLELYLAELRHVRHSVSGICRLSDVPSTTALRWVNKLESCGLVIREGDARDARRSLIKLSEKGFSSLNTLLEKIDDLKM